MLITLALALVAALAYLLGRIDGVKVGKRIRTLEIKALIKSLPDKPPAAD